MTRNDYRFVTRWRLPGPVEAISEVLDDVEALPRWWPSVYLGVAVLEPGDDEGVGRVVDLSTKGWLPYTLRWRFRVVEVRRPYGFTLEADGDFVGRGIWRLEPEGDAVLVTYDWSVRADKPLLRNLSFLLRPAFAANHRWAMARGEECLRLELARRRAPSEAAGDVPPPPGPTPSGGWAWLRYVLGGR